MLPVSLNLRRLVKFSLCLRYWLQFSVSDCDHHWSTEFKGVEVGFALHFCEGQVKVFDLIKRAHLSN